MRTIPSGIQTHLDTGLTTLARLLEIVLLNGTVIRLTDLDADLVYSSNTYYADPGFSTSAIDIKLGTDSQGITLTLIMGTNSITRDDIEAGLLDGARATIYELNYENVAAGIVTLFRGRLGEMKYTEKSVVTIEIYPLIGRDIYISVDTWSPSCRADLGDSRCTIDIESLKETLTVTSVTSKQRFNSSGVTAANGYYNNGVVVWQTGDNAGNAFEIAEYTLSGGFVRLQLSVPFTIQVGDTAFIYPGCDKQLATCRDKFNNILNFVGEPFLSPEAFEGA
jgi:uncharacterized phage protein (TIGR02218 family)